MRRPPAFRLVDGRSLAEWRDRAHSLGLFCSDPRVGLSQLGAEVFGGFSDYSQIADNTVLDQTGCQELLLSTGGVCRDDPCSQGQSLLQDLSADQRVKVFRFSQIHWTAQEILQLLPKADQAQ